MDRIIVTQNIKETYLYTIEPKRQWSGSQCKNEKAYKRLAYKENISEFTQQWKTSS